MPSSLPYGNAVKMNLVNITISPASVAANTAVAQTFTLPGALAGQDFVFDVTKPTDQAGLSIAANCRISANNTVSIVFVNSTASPIVPTASEMYTIGVMRRDGPPIGNMS